MTPPLTQSSLFDPPPEPPPETPAATERREPAELRPETQEPIAQPSPYSVLETYVAGW